MTTYTSDQRRHSSATAETMADVQEEVLAFARTGRDDDLAHALSVVTGQVREGAFGEVMSELARERGRLKP